jgi:hypothetical protein
MDWHDAFACGVLGWKSIDGGNLLKIGIRTITTICSLLVCWNGVTGTCQDLSLPKPLAPYTSCHVSDDLRVAKIDPLAPGVTSRTVDTAEGSKQIDMDAGIRVMFSYLFGDFFANVKVELLPASKYPALKTALLDNFNYIVDHSPGSKINSNLPSLHDFETHGEDRAKLEGGVLGVYLLFDDKTHVVTTIYMLNQEPLQRKFQTIEEYQSLRDKFLETYTGCIRENQALRH